MVERHVTKAESNIFEELGLPEAESLKVRAELMAEITQIWRDSGLKQHQMAEKMDVDSSIFSDVVKGYIQKCSIEQLVEMLASVGRHVTITVR